jgi:hypothetical protein
MLACKGGHYACAKLLTSKGASPLLADAQVWCPANHPTAPAWGQSIDKGCRSTQSTPPRTPSQGLNSLHYSALGGNPGCTLMLLKKAGLWGSRGPHSPKPSEPELFQ